ncbi:hypothetical protein LJ656_34085 [Paraburkholderia sp. MMS20-SJTR3]|uniref:ABC-three component systems C-terminal domain-containing protein n=1 Tax=Paraburkholderia sejongensis TaxID=2886946 RepID=A0ABS8K602_9BURK|nr:ABC-three component system protein [Paraburkholderia sp. MMS20-SJTR3]MCC8397583.1 hypothetical protein [Paraburkholderia sp. MMS20-SJTR3]
MKQTSVSAFNAGPSVLGYLYQVRLALVWAVRRSRTTDFVVKIEALDDVSFHADGDPVAVLQTKHALNTAASLGDLSAELWKTLRVWLVGSSSGEIPNAVAHFLITTSAVSEGTACEALSCDAAKRDIETAAKLLKHAASTSTNEELSEVFKAYLDLEDSARKALLENVFVVPEQPNVDEITDQLQSELYHVSLHHQKVAVQMVEGWWLRRVVHGLASAGGGISRAEIDAQIQEIQESLKPDSLPIDHEIDALMVALDSLPEFAHYPFYKQVELVGGSKSRIHNAVTSYWQAFRQRSLWTRDDLLFDTDLKQYETRLIREWELIRGQVCDELEETAGEKEMMKAGRAILKWAEDGLVPIKEGVSVPWVCRGSLHMLADERRLGWHPDFAGRLEAILDLRVEGST